MLLKRNLTSIFPVLYLLLNLFVVLSNFVDPVFGHSLLEEDRLVENITALGLAAAAFYLLAMVIKNREQTLFAKCMQVLIVLALFFLAGEEISWGQRIFHWQTTGLFKKDNLQGETNFHNLKVDGVKLNKVIFTYGAGLIGFFVFVIAPGLYKRLDGFKKVVNRFGAFLPQYKQTVFLLVGLAFVVLIKDSRKWELWECDAALMIFWMAADPINRRAIYQTPVTSKIY